MTKSLNPIMQQIISQHFPSLEQDDADYCFEVRARKPVKPEPMFPADFIAGLHLLGGNRPYSNRV